MLKNRLADSCRGACLAFVTCGLMLSCSDDDSGGAEGSDDIDDGGRDVDRDGGGGRDVDRDGGGGANGQDTGSCDAGPRGLGGCKSLSKVDGGRRIDGGKAGPATDAEAGPKDADDGGRTEGTDPKSGPRCDSGIWDSGACVAEKMNGCDSGVWDSGVCVAEKKSGCDSGVWNSGVCMPEKTNDCDGGVLDSGVCGSADVNDTGACPALPFTPPPRGADAAVSSCFPSCVADLQAQCQPSEACVSDFSAVPYATCWGNGVKRSTTPSGPGLESTVLVGADVCYTALFQPIGTQKRISWTNHCGQTVATAVEDSEQQNVYRVTCTANGEVTAVDMNSAECAHLSDGAPTCAGSGSCTL